MREQPFGHAAVAQSGGSSLRCGTMHVRGAMHVRAQCTRPKCEAASVPKNASAPRARSRPWRRQFEESRSAPRLTHAHAVDATSSTGAIQLLGDGWHREGGRQERMCTRHRARRKARAARQTPQGSRHNAHAAEPMRAGGERGHRRGEGRGSGPGSTASRNRRPRSRASSSTSRCSNSPDQSTPPGMCAASNHARASPPRKCTRN